MPHLQSKQRLGFGLTFVLVSLVVVGCTTSTNLNTATTLTNSNDADTNDTPDTPILPTVNVNANVNANVNGSMKDDTKDDGAMDDSSKNDDEVTAAPTEVTIQMTAKQWEFIPSTVTVKKGQKVKLVITSTDVAHGIGIPDFGVSAALAVGKTTTLEFTPDKTGSFTFFCNVFCGSSHREMKGTLIVQ